MSSTSSRVSLLPALLMSACLGDVATETEEPLLTTDEASTLGGAVDALAARADSLRLYDADYSNMVVAAHDSRGGDVVLVAGSHSENSPNWGTAPWDNGLLLVGGEGYEFTQRAQGESLAIDLGAFDGPQGLGAVQYRGSMTRLSDGATVEVLLDLWLWVTEQPARHLGKRYNVLDLDGVAGLRWQPFALAVVDGVVQVDADERGLTPGGVGELERGHLTNFRAAELAIAYDYVAVARPTGGDPGPGYAFVDFVSHPLVRDGVFGRILDFYLTRTASESLTLEGARLHRGNRYDVDRPLPSDGSVVLFENTVDLGIATLRRQMIRTTDGAGATLYGLREIFEAR